MTDLTTNELNVRDEFKHLPVQEVQEIAKANTNPFAVCVLSVTGGLNISTIIRTAHNLGAQEVIVFGKTAFDRRGMVGAQNYTNITKVSGLNLANELKIDEFYKTMVERFYMPIYIETGPNSVPLGEHSWKEIYQACMDIPASSPVEIRPCLVFGNEGEGIPEELIGDKDALVIRVPQTGVMRSFNVSACASIVMWDLVKEMGWL